MALPTLPPRVRETVYRSSSHPVIDGETAGTTGWGAGFRVGRVRRFSGSAQVGSALSRTSNGARRFGGGYRPQSGIRVYYDSVRRSGAS
jgi:hypothetical protein